MLTVTNKVGYVITRKTVSKKRSSFSKKKLPFFDRESDRNNRKLSARRRKIRL